MNISDVFNEYTKMKQNIWVDFGYLVKDTRSQLLLRTMRYQISVRIQLCYE